jgi:hypothetical protein
MDKDCGVVSFVYMPGLRKIKSEIQLQAKVVLVFVIIVLIIFVIQELILK